MLYGEKISMFNEIISILNGAEKSNLADFVKVYMEQEIKKKNTLTKSQKANLELKEMLLDIAFDGTATEVTAVFNSNYSANYSRNKIASLLTMLVREEKIKREMVGKTAIFRNGGTEE